MSNSDVNELEWEPVINDLQGTISSIAEAIESEDPSVEDLDVSFYHMGVAHVTHLANLIHNCRVVTKINFTCNDLFDEGCTALFFNLRLNTHVRIVDVSGNEIGPVGAKSIAECLEMNNTLTEINLYHNVIKDEGCRYIADALRVNKRLEFLSLRDNELTDVSGDLLLEVIRMSANLYLHGLWLRHNAIRDDTLIIANDILKKKHPSIHPTLYQEKKGGGLMPPPANLGKE